MTSLIGKKILITGGNGFLGSHIVNLLKDINCQVFAPRTQDLFDFRRLEDCDYFINKSKPDLIINCAAVQGGIGYHSGKQGDLFLDNILMGVNLLTSARKFFVPKFVNIIPGCAYPGYLEKDELNESDFWSGEVHDSIFSYGFSKKASIVYGKALYKQYGFNSIHLVLANLYGPGDHFRPDQSKVLAALIKKFYDAKKKNEPSVEIWGTGKPVRDWLYVKDAAAGILRSSEVYNNIEPLNIASGIGISVADLAKTIKKTVGYEGKLIFNTSKPDGAMKKTFGIKKMKAELNWLPQTSLDDGIKETVAWYEKHQQ